ncbi:MAG: hypothetical protein L0Z46_12895 [Nitrospiraceae bacterium]|nr:hypothetical protein [Nitrospiraceae bacterium]
MARKRIDISVMEGGLASGGQYYAKARDEVGREVATAYGRDSTGRRRSMRGEGAPALPGC